MRARKDFIEHLYFESPAVLSDLILLLFEDRPAGDAGGRPLQPLRDGFWVLPDEYPVLDAPAVTIADPGS